ncbi:hypothetical protein QAD02_006343 [Eretmocerus hayati]|uniref:Uncharacterized protein n=1 Tax=Eretmocerus hayati TaxID=131215 RepID=A0ACC2N1G3_9HYME|nr:hypothetical protein QAD02_006343 [Eretmocerus hayati]
MDQYLSSLSQEQKKLLSIVENGTLQNVSVALAQSSRLMDDEVYSYVTLVKALHRGHKSLSTLLIDKCSVVTTFKTKQYCTPLIYAIQLGDLKMFDLLYTRGASLFDRDAGDMNALELLVENQEHGLFVDFILDKYRNNINLDPESKKDQMIFHLACFKGDTEMMQKFIRCNFSINSHSNFRTKKWAGATPLQFALRDSVYGDPSRAVSLLLKLDVDLNTQDKHGNTPLHSAIKLIYIQDQDTEEKFVDNVFKAYIRRFNPEKACNLSNRDGISIFHLLCSFNWENEYENYSTKLLKIIKFFLNKNINVNSSNRLKSGHDYAGYTALHFATCANSLKIVKLLLKYGADPRKSDAEGSTALHLLNFSKSDSREILELLLKHGASVDAKNCKGYTPIHCAFYWQKRNKSLMNLIFDASRELKYFYGAPDEDNDFFASPNKIIKLSELVEENEDFDWALSRMNQIRIVELLLEYGASVNAKSLLVPPPLILSSQIPSIYHSWQYSEEFQKSIMDEIFTRQEAIIDTLLRFGADVDTRDDYGATLLHLLMKRWLERPNVKSLVETLLKKGANVEAYDSNGFSPLHLVVEKSVSKNRTYVDPQIYTSLIDLFFAYGANVNTKSKILNTPLHTVVKMFNPDVNCEQILVKLLDRSYVNINAQNEVGDTPLHLALRQRQFFCVKTLLNAAAINVNIENNDGLSPICIFYDGIKESFRNLNTDDVQVYRIVIDHVKNLKVLDHFISRKVTASHQSLLKYRSIVTK